MVQSGAEVRTAPAKMTFQGGYYSMRIAERNTDAREIECRLYKIIRDTTRLKIITAIPCFNTEHSIGDVVNHAADYTDEIIVVDDGSSDKTTQVASAAGAKVIKHDFNQGYGAAIKSCIKAFQNSDADILVTIDGDGQHNPQEIPLLVRPILEKKADVVIGSRFLHNHLNMPGYRRFGIKMITFLWNFGSKIRVTDSQSGFRAYTKYVVQDLELTENGMSLSIEMLEKIRKKKPVIKEVPINCSYENNNYTLTGKAFFHGFGVACSVLRIRLKYIISN
jgi:glycosyltransferase involved in cell wall biosynthesis